jgi:phosphoribosylanthranilate isomerase
MKLKLKICGLSEPDNIRQVAALLPDYMGFIFYKNSPRFVSDDFVMPQSLPASIKKIGVFVNETVQKVSRISKQLSLDGVQLHGTESIDNCKALKAVGLRVIKVFSVDDAFDFKLVSEYKSTVDYFLFDTKGMLYGGNGYVFNWNKLKEYDQEVPFFLSGGLSPDNILSVKELAGMNIHALDVNSGVEVRPGLKDVDLINEIKLKIERL